MTLSDTERAHLREWRILLVGWIFVVLAYMGALLAASALSITYDIERAGGGSTTGFDKLLHAFAFFILGVLLMQVFTAAWFPQGPLKIGGASFLVGILYAGVHEASQMFIPGLVAKPLDFVADVAGLAGAIPLVILWARTQAAISGRFATRR